MSWYKTVSAFVISGTRVYKNLPPTSVITHVLQTPMRGLYEQKSNTAYWWDASYLTHFDVCRDLAVDYYGLPLGARVEAYRSKRTQKLVICCTTNLAATVLPLPFQAVSAAFEQWNAANVTQEQPVEQGI